MGIPEYADADQFQGEMMHAESFSQKEIAAGKKVIVVGGGKSAIDCAVAAAKTAEHATLMFRFQFRLTGDFVPETRIEQDLFTGGQILSYEFRDMMRAGTVGARKGCITAFTENGVVLADGSA